MDRNQDGHVTPNELQFMLRNLGIHVRDDLIDDLMKDASHEGIKSFFFNINFSCCEMWNVNAVIHKYPGKQNKKKSRTYMRNVSCTQAHMLF